MSESRSQRDFVYEHSDIPPGMTIRDWRAQRAANRPRSNRPLIWIFRLDVRAVIAAAWRVRASDDRASALVREGEPRRPAKRARWSCGVPALPREALARRRERGV